MSIKLGLTGSIGMGKTTTAGFFRESGVPVWDADAEVHKLYAQGGAAVAAMGALVPEAVAAGFVDRRVLKAEISKNPALLAKIEAMLKPLLAQSRAGFLQKNIDKHLVLFDIPLLYETDAESWLDYVLVVTAPAEVQKARILARQSMDETMFTTLLARQMPDQEKRALADFVFDTSKGLAHTKADVKALIDKLEAENA